MAEIWSDGYLKVFFYLALCAFVTLGSFGVGLISGKNRNALYDAVDYTVDAMRLMVMDRDNLIGLPGHFMQPARQEGGGVTVNEVTDDDLILVAGFFPDHPDYKQDLAIRLMERDGTILAHWPASFTELFPEADIDWTQPNPDWKFDIHGLLADPDGSIIFNFEYNGTAKFGRCGDVEWTLPRRTHHSIARAEDGNFWVLDQRSFEPNSPDAFYPFALSREIQQFREDLLLKVSPKGEVLEEHSLPKVFMQSKDLEALLTVANSLDPSGARVELLHTNKIDVLTPSIADAFPDFEAGDLLLSFRRLNTLMVLNPDTMTVKWFRTGPWLRQHDPEFKPDGKISVFNNNSYSVVIGRNQRTNLDAPRTSEITEYDPKTDESVTVYGNRPGQEFLSVFRGDHQRLANGNTFVSENEAGRLFEVDPEGRMVWQYINRYDDQTELEMTDALVIPRDYFEVSDWSCG